MSWLQTYAAERLAEKIRQPEGKRIVKLYNRLGHTLMQFEMFYHRVWWQAVEGSTTGLQSSLLVRHPTTGRLATNFDLQLLQTIRETKAMQKLKVICVSSQKNLNFIAGSIVPKEV